MTGTEETIHATTVAIGGRAVVLLGPSGSGKSDLAIRLIDRGATLVSDDQTRLILYDDALHARAPATIAGRMELRGVGIVRVTHVDDLPVALVVRLTEDVPRLPDRRIREVCGVPVPEIALDPTHPSAPIKVEYALRRLIDQGATE